MDYIDEKKSGDYKLRAWMKEKSLKECLVIKTRSNKYNDFFKRERY